jgi:hypothetical protein
MVHMGLAYHTYRFACAFTRRGPDSGPQVFT